MFELLIRNIDILDCSFYSDYTRNCAEKFKAIINFMTFDVCQLEEGYKEYVMYHAIIENKPIGLKLEECTENLKKLSVQIIIRLMKKKNILKIFDLDVYCFSNKYTGCMRYKIIEKGEKVPNKLRPDGTESAIKERILQAFG